jgi:2-C-methyl-D-erythritol 2,4-cyclodiphosphate synthase
VSLVRARGYAVGNVDATVIAQAPKLAPFIAAMRDNVAADLGCDTSCVSIKATTTERLGFAGPRGGHRRAKRSCSSCAAANAQQ